LKELIDKGFVFQKEGEEDRRQRLLYLTDAGKDLHRRLMAPQIARIRKAITETNGDGGHAYRALLFHLIGDENRDAVRDWMGRTSVLGQIK
ncbi:MAG: MarR family transcriptional regulator, partial [Aestuariivirga sp.]